MVRTQYNKVIGFFIPIMANGNASSLVGKPLMAFYWTNPDQKLVTIKSPNLTYILQADYLIKATWLDIKNNRGDQD